MTLTALLAAASVMFSSPARAEGPSSDYCRKVTARAEADAALLFAPTASVQVIRYPQSAILDSLGIQVGRDVQPRGSVSASVVDIYKGFGVLDAAKKDCARQDVAVTLQEILLQRDEVGRRVAYERKLAFLRDKEPEMQGILGTAEQRFTIGSATLIEVHEIRRRVLELSSKALDAEREVETLKKRGTRRPDESLHALLTVYEGRSITYEESVEHVRNLAPWRLSVTGGVTAHPNFDYFGVAELSYNLGGLFQHGAEARATEARAQEIKNARYEMRQQIEGLQRELTAQAEVTRKQVALLDGELARVELEREAVAKTDAPNKPHVAAALALEVIDLGAERVFLNALSERQNAIGGPK
ncbi:hypothetical protein [Labilithrix luteola]|nr:hypothetical protein [Labilithrix luteola]